MKILIIGATGTIGKALADKLSAEHQVIRAGYTVAAIFRWIWVIRPASAKCLQPPVQSTRLFPPPVWRISHRWLNCRTAITS